MRKGSVWNTPPTNVPPPVIAPRSQGLPRPVNSPVSERASEKPMLTAAPMAVARPAKKAMCGSSVDSATAKIGASVESDPSINPISAGCTRERRNACSSSVKRDSAAALSLVVLASTLTGFQVGGSSTLPVDRESRGAPGLEAAREVGGALESEPFEVRRGQTRLVALVAHDDQLAPAIPDALVAVGRRGVAAPLEHVAREEHRAADDTVALALKLRADV